jgi:hypothetical protein
MQSGENNATNTGSSSECVEFLASTVLLPLLRRDDQMELRALIWEALVRETGYDPADGLWGEPGSDEYHKMILGNLDMFDEAWCARGFNKAAMSAQLSTSGYAEYVRALAVKSWITELVSRYGAYNDKEIIAEAWSGANWLPAGDEMASIQ